MSSSAVKTLFFSLTNPLKQTSFSLRCSQTLSCWSQTNRIYSGHVSPLYEGRQRFSSPCDVCFPCPTSTASLWSETGRGRTVLQHTAVRVLAQHQLCPSMSLCFYFPQLSLSQLLPLIHCLRGQQGQCFSPGCPEVIAQMRSSWVVETSRGDSWEKVTCFSKFILSYSLGTSGADLFQFLPLLYTVLHLLLYSVVKNSTKK